MSPAADEPTFVKPLTISTGTKVWDYSSIWLNTGKVTAGQGISDLYYDAPEGAKPRIKNGQGGHTSLNVQDPTAAGCQNAIDSQPNLNPITVRKGLTICASDNHGVALLEITSAPTADNTVNLKLTFWAKN